MSWSEPGQSSYRLLLPERQRRLEGIAHLLAVGTQGTASLHPPACGEDLAMPGPPTPQCDSGSAPGEMVWFLQSEAFHGFLYPGQET